MRDNPMNLSNQEYGVQGDQRQTKEGEKCRLANREVFPAHIFRPVFVPLLALGECLVKLGVMGGELEEEIYDVGYQQ